MPRGQVGLSWLPRRTWIKSGPCEGIIPPRAYDLAGSILPMKDRDQSMHTYVLSFDVADEVAVEVLAELSEAQYSRDLVMRDSCINLENSIRNAINNFEMAKALFDTAFIALNGGAAIGLFFELAPGAISAGIIITAAAAVYIMLEAMASCRAFNTCNGWPPSLIAVAGSVWGTAGVSSGVSPFLAALAKDQAWEKWSKLLTDGIKPLQLGLTAANIYGDVILGDAIKYNQAALACCQGSNCASAVCQQAAAGCLLSDGSFWTASLIPSGGLNCGAQ